MNYSIDGLKQDIRVALDENMSSEALISSGDIDTLSLDDIIGSKIVEAVRFVETNAPHHLLDAGTTFPEASQVITWESYQGYGPGSVPLPSDFMRLVCFKMTDWDRAVYDPILVTDPLYAVQRSRFAGLRGNTRRPVCALVPTNSGLILEFYGCDQGTEASVAMASYIPMPAVSSGSIAICEKLKTAAVYYAASLTAQTVGNANAAASLLNNCNLFMK